MHGSPQLFALKYHWFSFSLREKFLKLSLESSILIYGSPGCVRNVKYSKIPDPCQTHVKHSRPKLLSGVSPTTIIRQPCSGILVFQLVENHILLQWKLRNGCLDVDHNLSTSTLNTRFSALCLFDLPKVSKVGSWSNFFIKSTRAKRLIRNYLLSKISKFDVSNPVLFTYYKLLLFVLSLIKVWFSFSIMPMNSISRSISGIVDFSFRCSTSGTERISAVKKCFGHHSSFQVPLTSLWITFSGSKLTKVIVGVGKLCLQFVKRDILWSTTTQLSDLNGQDYLSQRFWSKLLSTLPFIHLIRNRKSCSCK